MNRENLENLTKGSRPSLHAATPDWNVLRGLVRRAAESLDDARNRQNSLATRFTAAYGGAFWLARVALEACGFRLAGAEGHRTAVFQSLANTLDWTAEHWRTLDDFHRFRNRFDYGDIIEVPEQQVEVAIVATQDLLDDVLRVFPEVSGD
ncbi:MAG TPA: hypothetical protein VIM81_21400 [Gammaproteobacteria bacterium]